ncbi:DUF3157 family protein [Vibrio neptunius]|uniref:DUF3157 family protein n=1 Tax=Vibrio neptunius TaxID=170651 RepID=A0ABS3A4A7_9VIBR|nr:DUF3157 family protein [Vibrio neptunius]MBN3494361.1 DUF3157 family protein [Vibrio neptunius]MBN3516826.1 DUF3157 family protein [Vibrio neptunius]MBN3551094.1 DUF3157 family protein [Vibrio neptunius]MBN3579223.1 DUF3157 family protein [Vibrio neptunius]MCH9872887.1 DUF3157 family protein [Vibrio neptunius]
MNKLIGLFTLLTSSLVFASQTVTLEDGRQVQLNDDFTWQYVVQVETTKTDEIAVVKETVQPAATIPIKKPKVATIPLIEKAVGTIATVGSNRATMQLSDSGVEVLLGAVSYENGQLIIPTSVTNQSSQSVILVEIEIQVSTTSGDVLSKKSVKVWQSIKRMADTYLRPQQVEQGKTIELAIDKAEQYLVTAKVVNLATR